MKDKFIAYEYDCIKLLFSIDEASLQKIFSKIFIPQLSIDSYVCRMKPRLQFKIDNLISKNFVVIEDFDTDSNDYKEYKNLNRGIKCQCRGKCESAAIVLAKKQKLKIISLNCADYHEEHNIENMSVYDCITTAIENEDITISEAKYLIQRLEIESYNDLSSRLLNFIEDSNT